MTGLAAYKQATRRHIASLNAELDEARRMVVAEQYRADQAERRERQIAAERDLWKHQAKAAEAELKSRGRGD